MVLSRYEWLRNCMKHCTKYGKTTPKMVSRATYNKHKTHRHSISSYSKFLAPSNVTTAGGTSDSDNLSPPGPSAKHQQLDSSAKRNTGVYSAQPSPQPNEIDQGYESASSRSHNNAEMMNELGLATAGTGGRSAPGGVRPEASGKSGDEAGGNTSNRLPPKDKPRNSSTVLPGFGRPVNYVPNKQDIDYIDDLFPNALSGNDISCGKIILPLTTLREFIMVRFMDSITNKPNWHVKVNDPEIAKKWKVEALANTEYNMTEKMVDWCIAEVKERAKLVTDSANPPPTFVFNGDVYKSDFALSPEFKKTLQDAVVRFEQSIPENLKDWHPHSNEQVLDLVHPSLFPLVYGRTRVLADGTTTTLEDCINRCGEGEITGIPSAKDTMEADSPIYTNHSWAIDEVKSPYSKKFQWLPCEVNITGEKARITSYINNLHPLREKPLYELIEHVITASIPMWEKTLAPLRGNFVHTPRIVFPGPMYDPDPGALPDTEGPQQREDEDSSEYYWERRDQWIKDTRRLIYPEPKDFTSLDQPPGFNLRETYGERGLQVIVKLANIELTPEKPEYAGGSWHVEGQINEHIVATAIYYYSRSNITKSSLAFRQQVQTESHDDIDYEQDDHDWLTDVFGCENQGPGIQEIGSVETSEGRLLSFPNVLQHRVEPFKLEDPSKPGHRKIVALFLVDPNIKVIGTAHVPCQQKHWWWGAVMDNEAAVYPSSSPASLTNGGKGIGELPVELQAQLYEQVEGFPIGLHEAKELRLELMAERTALVDHHHRAFESYTFSLCEH